MNDKPIEPAPIMRETPSGETVFKGTGNSHFSHVPGQGFHETTQVPGIGPNEGLPGGLSVHTPIDFTK